LGPSPTCDYESGDFKSFVAELKKYNFTVISGRQHTFNALLHTRTSEPVYVSAPGALPASYGEHGPAMSGGPPAGNK